MQNSRIQQLSRGIPVVPACVQPGGPDPSSATCLLRSPVRGCRPPRRPHTGWERGKRLGYGAIERAVRAAAGAGSGSDRGAGRRAAGAPDRALRSRSRAGADRRRVGQSIDAAHPREDDLIYVADVDAGKAWWASRTHGSDAYLDQFLGAAPERVEKWPGLPGVTQRRAAPMIGRRAGSEGAARCDRARQARDRPAHRVPARRADVPHPDAERAGRAARQRKKYLLRQPRSLTECFQRSRSAI